MRYTEILCIFFITINKILANHTYGDCEEKWENKLIWEYEVRRPKIFETRNVSNIFFFITVHNF